jgi:hypothetical protein
MDETTGCDRKERGACVECGRIFFLGARGPGRPRKRCPECAEDIRRDVPLLRRTRWPNDPDRLREFARPCLGSYVRRDCPTPYLPDAARSDAQTCSDECRQALYRYVQNGGRLSMPPRGVTTPTA